MERTQILLRLPKDLKDEVGSIAEQKGVSTTGLILMILNQYIEERSRRNETKNKPDTT